VYAVQEEDLGRGKGRRLECSVCNHSWFQSKDRIMHMRDGFSMVPLPQSDRDRIASNIEQGLAPKFLGDVKLYVGNVAFECHEDDIYEIFSRVADVGDVSLVRDEAGKNRGFGFVTMRTKEDGLKAIEALDGVSVRGRNIAVRESNS
jgi:RNA recognition motif-containing protein